MADGISACGRELRILPDRESACSYVVELITSTLSQAVAQRKRAAAVLAGGGTPAPVYESLPAFEGIDRVDWPLGDERLVKPGSSDSNLAMISGKLFERLGIEPQRVTAPRLDLPTDQVVDDYQRRVLAVLERDPERRFDLVFLGLGADGHTASLFARRAVRDDPRLVHAVEAPVAPRARVTLSARALSRTRLAVFLVLGESKAQAVRRAALAEVDPSVPGSWIRPEDARVLWVVDRGAASRLV